MIIKIALSTAFCSASRNCSVHFQTQVNWSYTADQLTLGDGNDISDINAAAGADHSVPDDARGSNKYVSGVPQNLPSTFPCREHTPILFLSKFGQSRWRRQEVRHWNSIGHQFFKLRL